MRRRLYDCKIPTQLLNSLTTSNNNIIGLNDSISNNNADYTNSPCFYGSKSAYIDIGNDRSSLEKQNVLIEFSIFRPNIPGYEEGLFCIGSDALNTGGNSGYGLTIVITSNNVFSIIVPGSTIGIYTSPLSSSAVYNIKVRSLNGNVSASINGSLFSIGADYTPKFGATVKYNLIGAVRLFGSTQRKSNSKFWDFKISELDTSGNTTSVLAYYPLSEPIITPATHKYFDATGNLLTSSLISGVVANNGTQDVFHYGQNGFTLGNGTNGALLNNIIPAKLNSSLKDAIGNDLSIVNDGYMFLNYAETKIKNSNVQILKDKDVNNLWFDINGMQNNVSFNGLINAITMYNDVYYGDINQNVSIKNITLW